MMKRITRKRIERELEKDRYRERHLPITPIVRFQRSSRSHYLPVDNMPVYI